jgi:disulfide bond formation protein DsbB
MNTGVSLVNAIVPIFTNIFSILTIVGQLIILLALVFVLFFRKKKNPLLIFGAKNGTLFALVVAVIATSGSLFYSEVAGYQPCELCWFQRILMYPQVILLSVAFLMKDKNIPNYLIPVSLIGMGIAAYHYILQLGLAPAVCSTVGISVSCSQTPFMQFGYITIPMMSLTAFSLIVLYMTVQKIYGKDIK